GQRATAANCKAAVDGVVAADVAVNEGLVDGDVLGIGVDDRTEVADIGEAVGGVAEGHEAAGGAGSLQHAAVEVEDAGAVVEGGGDDGGNGQRAAIKVVGVGGGGGAIEHHVQCTGAADGGADVTVEGDVAAVLIDGVGTAGVAAAHL